jgi:RNA polymerase sigma-70 factor, ECF subfamily
MFFFPILFALADAEADREIARRLKNREQDALGQLYDRYGRLVYSVIFRIVKNTSVAEDLVQETFLRVWNRVQGFDEDKGALGPWILTIARNRAIDYLRSIDGRMSQNMYELSGNEQPGFFGDLEKDMLNSDRARVLRAAFKKLNQNQQMVIELAYFEGLSQTEMAEKMNQPLGTVKTWVRTALQALRNELGEALTA